jgi:hypothetical protein
VISTRKATLSLEKGGYILFYYYLIPVGLFGA